MKIIYDCLIVEDEFLCTRLITNFLKKYDEFKTPETAGNFSEAREAIKKTNFDLIFLDIHLPDGNALDFLKTTILHMPLIFLTADKNHSLAAFEANVVDYLVKPFSEQRFNRAVSKALEIIAGRSYLKKKNQSGENIFKNSNLESILRSRYNLSSTECAICSSIAAGKTINEIMEIHSITRNTLKTHLRRIFSKTIEHNEVPAMEGQRKLQRLTYFLINLG